MLNGAESSEKHGNIGCGVSSSGILNQVYFLLKVNRFKINLNGFLKWNTAEQRAAESTKIGPIFAK